MIRMRYADVRQAGSPVRFLPRLYWYLQRVTKVQLITVVTLIKIRGSIQSWAINVARDCNCSLSAHNIVILPADIIVLIRTPRPRRITSKIIFQHDTEEVIGATAPSPAEQTGGESETQPAPATLDSGPATPASGPATSGGRRRRRYSITKVARNATAYVGRRIGNAVTYARRRICFCAGFL